MAFKDPELEELAQQILNKAWQKAMPQQGTVMLRNNMQKAINRRLSTLRK